MKLTNEDKLSTWYSNQEVKKNTFIEESIEEKNKRIEESNKLIAEVKKNLKTNHLKLKKAYDIFSTKETYDMLVTMESWLSN